MEKDNKMGVMPVRKLLLQMGLPMILSMVLQSIYNIVDTAFVINMGEEGPVANLALTYAFPIQLLIIAIGVGTGVGVNALLSRKLGEGERQTVERIAGNAVTLGMIIYGVFLLFGIFGADAFIALQTWDETVIAMGGEYLRICCCLSFGAIGFTIYERFLQSTGKTHLSTVSQIVGAVANVVLDYVFIYPLRMGVAGAAWATVIGQVLSLVVAAIFHYGVNKEIKNSFKALKPDKGIIIGIYKIGLSAALMQGLLSVMMLGMNLILGTAKQNATLLQGSFGVYYKIMQFALFAFFGLSNTIISVLAYNYGIKDEKRAKDSVLYGILYSVGVALIITVLFEACASPIAELFALASGEGGAEIKKTVTFAVRIATIGYVFMAFNVAVQGVLQALRYAMHPLVIALLRLGVFVFPLAAALLQTNNPVQTVWWAFPVAEVLTAAYSGGTLFYALKRRIRPLGEITDPPAQTVCNSPQPLQE